MDGFVVALQSDCFHKTSWTIDDWGHYTVQWAAVKTHQNSVQIQSLQNPWQCELCVHKSLLDVIIHLQDLVWGCSCFLLALGWWRESKPAASIWTWSSSNWCYYPQWAADLMLVHSCTERIHMSQLIPRCANMRQQTPMSQDGTRCHKVYTKTAPGCRCRWNSRSSQVVFTCFLFLHIAIAPVAPVTPIEKKWK